MVVFGPLDVDLLASKLTDQIPRFFSWRPDPLVEAVSMFQQDWGPLKGFANPPWCLNGRVLSQAHCQQATSTSVEGSNLVPSSTKDVVGFPQTDSPSPRSNS